MKVITRFPPSPTGKLQLGNARTALFNYLFAKHNGGSFLFRLEDTDRERSKKEYESDIVESLKWLGLKADNTEIWRQSERGHIYKTRLRDLVDRNLAYVSKESELSNEAKADFVSPKRQEGTKRDEVIRFKNPNKIITFTDLIRGEIKFDTTELGDFVIAKSMEEPIYHLAVVIDDAEMGISHVIRGEDGISNTPRQILIQEAFGFQRPEYAHVPLILAHDRTKLSKRRGAIPVSEYRAQGFLPEAVVNYLALLGWNPGTDKELFSMGELIEAFDLAKVQKGGAVFGEEKLRWFNKEYLKREGVSSLIPHIPREISASKTPVEVAAIAEMLFERISVFSDIQKDIASGELDYLFKEPAYPPTLLQWKKATEGPKAHLEETLSALAKISQENFTKSGVKDALMSYAEAKGKGNVLWPMRVALSGREQSPDPFTIAACLGKTETLSRLKRALSMIQ